MRHLFRFCSRHLQSEPGLRLSALGFQILCRSLLFEVCTGKAEEVEAFVKKMLEENLPPSIQLHISTLQEDIHQAQAIENNMKGIILFFSFVSLIITFIRRLFGNHTGYGTQTKEVAIRKVNGAGLKQIIILFARTYIYQLVLSATMAFPLCYAILQLWKNMYIVFFNDGPLFWFQSS